MSIRDRLTKGNWVEAMPINFQLNTIKEIDEKLISYNDVAEEVNNTKKVLIAIYKKKDEAVEPVSLKNLTRFLDVMESAVNDNLDCLTYPRTMLGYEKMLSNLMVSASLKDLAVFYTLSPSNFLEAYKKNENDEPVNSNHARNKKWILSVIKNEEKKDFERFEMEKKQLEEEKRKFEQEKINLEKNRQTYEQVNGLINSKPLNLESNESKKPEKISEEKFYPKKSQFVIDSIQKLTTDLRSVFDIIVKGEFENSDMIANKMKIIDSIKLSAQKYKNETDKSTNDWFKDVLLESQYDVLFNNEEKNKAFNSHSFLSITNNMTKDLIELNLDTKELLEDPAFWGILKKFRENTDKQNYKIMVEMMLPKFMSLNGLDQNDKVNIGYSVINFTKKDDFNFQTRLNLWLGIGGDFKIINNDKKTIVDLIVKENNEMWNNSLINIAKDNNENLHKYFPKNFERVSQYNITNKDVEQARRQPNII